MQNQSFIKSPLNYTGNKFKLLSSIIPVFPTNISVFIDLFGGGGDISVNTRADKIIYNDISTEVTQIIDMFKNNPLESTLEYIDNLINQYNLSTSNQEGYLNLRQAYNNSTEKNPLMLYTLICYSFNNQIRFNSKGEYNMPFGKSRSSFNSSIRDNLIDFCNNFKSKDITITNYDFRHYRDFEFTANTFVYCDPPYINSVATYNENNAWTLTDEQDLLSFLNELTSKDIKWGLSNDLKTNPDLREWADDNKYNIKYIQHSYSNCAYTKKDRISNTIEVLITNYKPVGLKKLF